MKKVLFLTLAILLISSMIISSCSEPAPEPQPSPTIAPTAEPSPTSQPEPTSKPEPTSQPKPTAEPSGPKYGGTMTFIWDPCPVTPIGWPAEAFGVAVTVMDLCAENLLRERADATYEPCLAESYDVHPDELYIDFKIRKGVKFHDGSDLTPEVVRWNYQSLIDASAWGTDNWESVEVIGDDTVRFHLKTWRCFELRSYVSPYIISKEAYDKNGLDWVRWNLVGTGPFKFVSFEKDASFKTVRNDNYWREGLPYLDAIDVIFPADWTTQKAVMLAGDADFMFCELGKVVADMRDLGFEVVCNHQTVFCMVTDSVNEDSPYSDKRVRMALEYAIDKEEIAEGLGHGLWEAPYQVIPRDHPSWDPDYKGGSRTYDPEKAKALLAEAGYPDGFKTTLNPAAAALDRNVNVAVQQYLADVGIDAELEFAEQAKYMEYAFNGWNNRILHDTISGYANYLYTLNMFFHPEYKLLPSLKRPDGYADMFYDALYDEELDVQKLRDICYYLIEEEAMVIPIYEAGKGIAYNDYIKDAGFFAFGDPWYFTPETAWLDK